MTSRDVWGREWPPEALTDPPTWPFSYDGPMPTRSTMSTDAFGNSPAMTFDEMVAEGLIDEFDNLTEKGRKVLRMVESNDQNYMDDVHRVREGYGDEPGGLDWI